MRRITKMCASSLALAMTGCAFGTGIHAVGPGVYAVQDFRAPAVGGFPEAQRMVLLEADDFCRRQGLVFAPVAMRPDGNPYGIYGPSGFDAVFSCRARTDTIPPPSPPPRQPSP